MALDVFCSNFVSFITMSDFLRARSVVLGPLSAIGACKKSACLPNRARHDRSYYYLPIESQILAFRW